MDKTQNLIWIDLEMTGLNPEVNTIIEIATIVTDAHLNVLEEGPNLAVHQSDEVLAHMDEWCTRTHGDSGLTDRVRATDVTLHEAEQRTLDYVKKYTESGVSPLCGNSIGQDRRFLAKYMPELEAHCHYRNIDVSSIKEIARRWRPEILNGFSKQGSHLALDDIKESIAELRYYKSCFFRFDS